MYFLLALDKLAVDLQHTREKATLPEGMAIVACHVFLYSQCLPASRAGFVNICTGTHICTKGHITAVQRAYQPSTHRLRNDVALHVFTSD